MKSLDIQFNKIDCKKPLTDIITVFNDIEPVDINVINWEEYSYLPRVNFLITYSEYAIYIKFNVTEQSVLARKHSVNDSVYQDSCVEFFVSPGDGLYHNFEFNPIGTTHAGEQKGRGLGTVKDNQVVEKVRTYSSLGNKPFEEIKEETTWSLAVEIPFNTFTNRSFDEIKGSSMKANFYKCGDQLTIPHFVTWNNIDTENPDFHRPECFGVINFK